MRAETITRKLREHDRELYCGKNKEGTLCVFRNTRTTEAYEVDGSTIIFVRTSPYYVFSLTRDWTARTEPVEWGIEPIMQKVRYGDLWNNDQLVEDLIKGYEKDKESSERDFQNETEAFLKDWRRQVAKDFADVNTSTMDKTDPRKKWEKKNGYCK